MTNDTSIESSWALLLESAKKFANLQKLIFYRKIQLQSKNVCKLKFVQKMKNYTFLKTLDHVISNMRKFLQNFN